MKEEEILDLWRSYDKKLETSLALNRKNAEDITKMKVRSLIFSMKPIKIFTILTGLVWVGLGGVVIIHLFIFAFHAISKFFLISAAIQLLLTAAALVIYIYQFVLIHMVDISEPVLATQEKIARLKSSTLWVTRLLFLQLPVWTTFYISESMIRNIPYLIVNGLITLIFTIIAVWLFFNIDYKNSDKRWFKILFSGNEWDPLTKSMGLLIQIKEAKTQEHL